MSRAKFRREVPVECAEDIVELLGDLAEQPREVFVVVPIINGYAQDFAEIARGDNRSVEADADDIAAACDEAGANECICLHTHAGHPCRHSDNDRISTALLVPQLLTRGITLLDALVIGTDGFCSILDDAGNAGDDAPEPEEDDEVERW